MVEPEYICPSDVFLKVIKGKCKTTIIVLIQRNINRFSEIRRSLPTISERMLSTQLNELVRDGIIRRESFNEIPPRVEYYLTEYGETIYPIIKEMRKWGYIYLERQQK
ncbi:MAG TPA: helix-turn-helix domain-containing protein [Dysgonomonas sp.]|uniref:Transcriptional regulator n=1 Tax=Dysgonomonas mossii TaxID=163665 RepID=A0A4Y9IJL3_9BACT|nr:helix-turn-helix domain-containing protein [Dysgonomonas sp.]MBF0761833.1 helix-turn-helix transcriptional regulator [Dysgonomonas mossii]TFU88663.1 transcriptional regulator [Dysgonomonas mossii]HML66589.1 helix-turn-helix domain-containing protein [Dysgonomonas sp.]